MPPRSVVFEHHDFNIADELPGVHDFITHRILPQPALTTFDEAFEPERILQQVENLPFRHEELIEDDNEMEQYQPTDATYSPINLSPINLSPDTSRASSPVAMELYSNVLDEFIPSRYIRAVRIIPDPVVRQEILEGLRDRELRNIFDTFDISTPEGIDRAHRNLTLDLALERRLIQVLQDINVEDAAAAAVAAAVEEPQPAVSDSSTSAEEFSEISSMSSSDDISSVSSDDDVINPTPRRRARRVLRRFNPLRRAQRRLNFDNM
ncbi:hypothetical protein KM622_gp006 [Spodoptera exempta nucleopolyhedrovirus]|uniref:Uncharacterized protein n=1 Tax=Spodoptera exempta nucleopolyhedrovirus TaxID=1242863 RepID=A0A410S7J7_9ABAC|nr:hypothetical protein KM622_gp006 [Spodoptera exempta nucleopolyhedrovirus]QAT90292.1 hypothetical protein [Spodoptera exempta nucleopolyhedrovirus]